MDFNRAILILLAINEGKGVVEMEPQIGASRQIVQRYLSVLLQGGYYTVVMGPTGKKIKTRSRKLTEQGKTFLRSQGHNV